MSHQHTHEAHQHANSVGSRSPCHCFIRRRSCKCSTASQQQYSSSCSSSQYQVHPATPSCSRCPHRGWCWCWETEGLEGPGGPGLPPGSCSLHTYKLGSVALILCHTENSLKPGLLAQRAPQMLMKSQANALVIQAQRLHMSGVPGPSHLMLLSWRAAAVGTRCWRPLLLLHCCSAV